MSLDQIRGQITIKNLKLNQEKTTFQTIQMGEQIKESIYIFEKYLWEYQPNLITVQKTYLPLILLDHGNREYVAVSCCNFPHQVIFLLHSLPYKSEDNLLFLYFHYALRKKNTNLYSIFILYIDTVD